MTAKIDHHDGPPTPTPNDHPDVIAGKVKPIHPVRNGLILTASTNGPAPFKDDDKNHPKIQRP